MMKSKLWPWLLIAFVVVLLDQISKHLILQHLNYGQPLVLLPFLNFDLSYNQGAAFSFLTNAGGWQRYLFAGIAIIISIFILVWLTKLKKNEKTFAFGLSLVLGGAIGNLIDRINLGYVIDFIDFHIQNWHYATFNLADSAICIGAVLIASQMLFKGR